MADPGRRFSFSMVSADEIAPEDMARSLSEHPQGNFETAAEQMASNLEQLSLDKNNTESMSTEAIEKAAERDIQGRPGLFKRPSALELTGNDLYYTLVKYIKKDVAILASNVNAGDREELKTSLDERIDAMHWKAMDFAFAEALELGNRSIALLNVVAESQGITDTQGMVKDVQHSENNMDFARGLGLNVHGLKSLHDELRELKAQPGNMRVNMATWNRKRFVPAAHSSGSSHSGRTRQTSKRGTAGLPPSYLPNNARQQSTEDQGQEEKAGSQEKEAYHHTRRAPMLDIVGSKTDGSTDQPEFPTALQREYYLMLKQHGKHLAVQQVTGERNLMSPEVSSDAVAFQVLASKLRREQTKLRTAYDEERAMLLEKIHQNPQGRADMGLYLLKDEMDLSVTIDEHVEMLEDLDWVGGDHSG